ncbi:hypothetical protein [Candidatus Formimonas warabiya]|uniref:Uncharacterized protein n=1 Tax=Formimonas warabiya TaxID=1761012 RepID=A0A3G1KPS9_FORW1|nr:hypothetical protein [Candidatus Formimonas warabiya]ATW24474.1 hypothetical protein DCMF_06500 [Candidatus Formimonas warabiya]
MRAQKKAVLVKKRSQLFKENYINEVRGYLKQKFGFKPHDVEKMINKFENLMKKDSTFVFHYDSHYWAQFIAESVNVDTKNRILV